MKLTYLFIEILIISIAIRTLLLNNKKIKYIDAFIFVISFLSLLGVSFSQIRIFNQLNLVIHFLAALSFIVIIFKPDFNIQTIKLSTPREIIILIFIILASLVFRYPYTNFIFIMGDPGVYVNNGNFLASVGMESNTKLMPLTSVWLGIFSLFAGAKYSYFALVFFSILLIVSFYRFIKQIYEYYYLAIIGAILVSTNILSIASSKMPYSENIMIVFLLNILIYYQKYLEALSQKDRNRNEIYFYIILISLLVGSASLTRITGFYIFIMFSINFIFQIIFEGKNLKEHFALFILASLFYGYSVYHGVFHSPGYYLSSGYFPEVLRRNHFYFLKLIHILPFLFPIVLFSLYFRVRAIRVVFIKSSEMFICFHKRYLSNNIQLFGLILIYIAIISFGNYLLTKRVDILTFMMDIANHKIENNVYYHHLTNYFSFASLIFIPLGFIAFFKEFNFINNSKFVLLWIFITIALVFSTSTLWAPKRHEWFLYPARYFYSELFILMVLFFLAFLNITITNKSKIMKGFAFVVLLIYLVHSLKWYSINRNYEYLKNAYSTLEKISKNINKENSVVFLNTISKKSKKRLVASWGSNDWMYRNVGRCVMLPLYYTFGYEIGRQYFSVGNKDDKELDYTNLINTFNKKKKVYIINVIKIEDEPYLKKNIITKKINEFNSIIETKFHFPENIFHKHIRKSRFKIEIRLVEKI